MLFVILAVVIHIVRF